MIPRRGLRWSAQNIGVGRRRLELASTRSFSSITPTRNGSSNPVSVASRTGTWGRRIPLRPQTYGAASTVRNGASIRFQSTSPVVSGAKDTVAASLDTTTLAQGSTDFAALEGAIDLASSNLNNIPEQIGYLNAMGLQYGYGPTGLMEWVFEHVHVLAGTPWWASIAITAMMVRIAFLYPSFLATDNAAKMAALAPLTKPLSEKMKESARQGDNTETMKLRTEIQKINKRGGVSYFKAFLPFSQAPIGFGSFFLLRGMSNLPVPGLETGGLLWFSNLTIPDPFFIIPLSTSAILHFLLKKGGETGVQNSSTDILRAMSIFLPIISLVFTAFLPSAIQIYFFVTGVLSYIQARVFSWTPFRTYMNMTPVPTASPAISKYTSTSSSSPPVSPYQPRIIIAPSRPSPNYQAPRASSSSSLDSGPSTPKATLFSGLRREVSSGISAVQDSARATLKSAREIAGQEESKDGKRTKRQLQLANEYEKKRRLEESKRRVEADRERRARRERRRFGEG